MKRAGVGRVELDAVGAGDIASIAGMPTAGIADTVAAFAAKEGLDPGTIEPPTMRCLVPACDWSLPYTAQLAMTFYLTAEWS